jgi:uncharacterized SAM-binding protein YcdF (DUF218 family)
MTYLQPILPLLLVLSLVLHLVRKRSSRRLHWFSLFSSVSLFLWAWPPAAWLLAGTLEWWYPPEAALKDPEAIVVLSGSIEGREVGLEHRLTHGSATRCAFGAWLHLRRYRVPVVITGDQRITSLMRAQMIAHGVPEQMIWQEPQSSSTSDHAVNCAKLLTQKGIRRIALVTEAYHMLRSEASFRKQGLDVQPAPCGFRTSDFGDTVSDWIPGSRAIRSNEEIAHEWVGLAYYWVRGRV